MHVEVDADNLGRVAVDPGALNAVKALVILLISPKGCVAVRFFKPILVVEAVA